MLVPRQFRPGYEQEGSCRMASFFESMIPLIPRRGASSDQKSVTGLTGLSRSQIYRLMKAGEFPSPYAVGQRKRLWRFSEVAEWMRDLQHPDHDDQRKFYQKQFEGTRKNAKPGRKN